MSLRRVARLAMLLLVLLTALAGCEHYWGKPGGTAAQFEIDSRECVKESSPTAQMVAYRVRERADIPRLPGGARVGPRGEAGEQPAPRLVPGGEDWD